MLLFVEKNKQIRRLLTKRGEKELCCLEKVRKQLAPEDCMGMTNEDWEEIKKCLKTAVENEQKNNFPDFVFDNGFIEHFQVTSSKSTRKGSNHLKSIKHYKNETDEKFKQVKKEWEDNPMMYKERKAVQEYVYKEHDYEYLKQSILHCFENHMNSLDKYDGNKEVGIFLIEYTDCAVSMAPNYTDEVFVKINNGDLKLKRKIVGYSPAYDKEMLEYFKQLKDKIKYIIWVNRTSRHIEGLTGIQCCENYDDIKVIKIDNIPDILANMPVDYKTYPESVILSSVLHGYSIPTEDLHQ